MNKVIKKFTQAINPYKYLLETLLFMLVVLILGYSKGNPAFVGITSHPFFIIILLISIRYGYLKGVISTVLLTGTYLYFSLTIGVISQSEMNYWAISQQVLAFFAFAMFVGLLVEVDKKKVRISNKRASSYKDTIDDNEIEINKILSINGNLSNQIATADQSFNVIFYSTKDFYNEDILKTYQVAYDLLINTVKATAAYIFLLEKSQFKLILPTEEATATDFLAANSEVIEQLKNSNEFYRLDKITNTTESTPIFMGPIIHEESNHVYGLLVVKEIDFINYNESSFITFKNLCKWLGEILHFRSSQNIAVAPKASHPKAFNYLVAYGAPKSLIQQKLSDYFKQFDKYE